MSDRAAERDLTTDVLVIGGGMAGMVAAIKAKERGLDVTLTDKAYVGKAGSTHFAEGDIVCFRESLGHKMQEWLEIISKRCEYLNDREWDEICLREAEDRYNDLVGWGVEFHHKDGELYRFDTSSVGAPPSVYQDISMETRKYAPTLRRKVLESGVRVLDNVMMIELLKRGGTVVGAVGFHIRGGRMYVIKARATVIATGSANLKSETYPTHYWTGDGEAMAYRAGAEVTGKEFAGGVTRSRFEIKRQLEAGAVDVSSAEIVDGSYLHPYAIGGGFSGWYSRPTLNAEGGPVMTAAWEAHCGRAPLYFDPSDMNDKKREWMQEYFKRIELAWAQADKIDLDVFRGGLIKWPPSGAMARPLYTGSGIAPVDTNCATAVPGLYAAGNACATRGSGAMYAGMGFAMNHAMVTGNRAGVAAAQYAAAAEAGPVEEAELERAKAVVRAPLERKGGFAPAWVTQMIRTITVPYFYLLVKHGERLQAAVTIAEFINRHLVPKLMAGDVHELRLAQETRNMALVAEMKLKSSLFRTESRGDHFREDFPRREDPDWLAWVMLKDEQGEMTLRKQPVPKEWWPDLDKPYEERYGAVLPLEERQSPEGGRDHVH
jgi:succinate dehydrogenase/fumarate reductase flavoprotein subunit